MFAVRKMSVGLSGGKSSGKAKSLEKMDESSSDDTSVETLFFTAKVHFQPSEYTDFASGVDVTTWREAQTWA